MVAVFVVIGAVIVVVTGVFSSDDQPVASDTSAGDEIISTPFGLVYSTHFRNPDLDGEWGQWAAADAQPPEDIASDFYPELGPYSSNDPGVLDEHLVWIERTGADLLVVTWQGAESGDDALFGSVLEAAHQAGVAVIPLIETYPERLPESVIREPRSPSRSMG